MEKCAHRYTMKVLDCFIDEDRLCFVMPYYGGGNLEREISRRKKAGQPFTESEILRYFTQICLGLRCIHFNNCLHRDLKSLNIMLQSINGKIECVIGDFGVVKQMMTMTNMALTQTGTIYMMSPEVINRQPYDAATDVWSAGVLLYEMCTLQRAFGASTNE